MNDTKAADVETDTLFGGGTAYLTFLIVLSTISVICLFFNVLSSVVFVRLARCQSALSPIYHSLAAMGVADTIIMLLHGFYFISSLLQINQSPTLFHDIVNKLWIFPSNFCSRISNWILISTIIFYLVSRKVSRWCSVMRIRILIVAVILLVTAISIPIWWQMRIFIMDDVLYIEPRGLLFFDTFALTDLLPMVTMLVVIVILIVYRCRKRGSPVNKQQKENVGVCVMLLLLAIWYFMCYAFIVVGLLLDLVVEMSHVNLGSLRLMRIFGPVFNHGTRVVFYSCNRFYRNILLKTLKCKKIHTQPLSADHDSDESAHKMLKE